MGINIFKRVFRYSQSLSNVLWQVLSRPGIFVVVVNFQGVNEMSKIVIGLLEIWNKGVHLWLVDNKGSTRAELHIAGYFINTNTSLSIAPFMLLLLDLFCPMLGHTLGTNY
jgi:hypothetical protein